MGEEQESGFRIHVIRAMLNCEWSIALFLLVPADCLLPTADCRLPLPTALVAENVVS